MKELGLLKHFRFIFTKILVAKLMVLLYVYNKALNYFFEVQLRMPASMAKPFGEYVGSLLRSTDN